MTVSSSPDSDDMTVKHGFAEVGFAALTWESRMPAV